MNGVTDQERRKINVTNIFSYMWILAFDLEICMMRFDYHPNIKKLIKGYGRISRKGGYDTGRMKNRSNYGPEKVKRCG